MKKEMGPSGPSGRKVINVTLQHDVQLNKSENAWKPQLITKKDVSQNDDLATYVCIDWSYQTVLHFIGPPML